MRKASRIVMGGVPVCSNGIHSFSSSTSSAMIASSDNRVVTTGPSVAGAVAIETLSRRASNQAVYIR